MAVCRTCGLSISETATFCAICGTPVEAGANASTAQPPS